VLAAIGDDGEAAVAAKFAVMRPFPDERGWRVCPGTGADQPGYGGTAAVARAPGAPKTTAAAGAAEARGPRALAGLPPGSSRQAGAGRPRAQEKRPGSAQEPGGLPGEGRRGGPVPAVTRNILSLRDIARQMTLRGFPVSGDTVSRLMHEAGCSLQGMARVLEGSRHEDRDLRSGNISAEIARAVGEGGPVISAGGKKKEPPGACGRDAMAARGAAGEGPVPRLQGQGHRHGLPVRGLRHRREPGPGARRHQP
jgi:hypothetical protein